MYVKTINTKQVSVFYKECEDIFVKSFPVLCSFGNRDVTFELFRALRPLLNRGLQLIVLELLFRLQKSKTFESVTFSVVELQR